jgi:hypothetical protein
MGGDPKTPRDAVLDPEARLDLLVGHLGTRRERPSEREAPAASSSTVRTRSAAARTRTYTLGLARLVIDRAAFDLAKDLLERSDACKGITCELLEKSLHLDKTTRPRPVAHLFDQVFESAQSAKGELV